MDSPNVPQAPGGRIRALGFRAIRRGGAAAFVGALTTPLTIDASLLMRADLTLRGSFWFPRGTPAALLRMIASAALDVSRIEVEVFPLDEINRALERSLEASGGLRHVALGCSV